MISIKAPKIVLFFGISTSFCYLLQCKNYDFNEYIKDKINARQGTPTLFELNAKPYSAKSFRQELYFERAHMEQQFDPPMPEEIERKLSNYIEESIILREAISKIDYNSSDARAYMWPYIRKAVIAYYLERESGNFELIENYSDIEVSDELIKEYYQKNKARFKGENEVETIKKLRNTAIYLKWRKLYESKLEKKKFIIGQMKKNNKVKLEPKELLNVQ